MEMYSYLYLLVSFIASAFYTVSIIMLSTGKHQKAAAILSVVAMALYMVSVVVVVSLI